MPLASKPSVVTKEDSSLDMDEKKSGRRDKSVREKLKDMSRRTTVTARQVKSALLFHSPSMTSTVSMNSDRRRATMLGNRAEAFAALMENEKPRGHGWVVHPDRNPFARVFDKLVIICLVFTILVTPYEVAFMPEAQLGSARFWVNRLVDAIFSVDLVLQFFLIYSEKTSEGTVWVYDHKQVVVHYLQSWFLIDFIAVVPFDTIGRALAGSGEASSLRALKIIRCLRLLKLFRVINNSSTIKRIITHVGYSHQRFALLRFLLMLLIASHWLACVWGILVKMEEGGVGGIYTWLSIQEELGRDSGISYGPFDVYLASLYWAVMTLTSIGYGDTSRQGPRTCFFFFFLIGYGDIIPENTTERCICCACMILCGAIWASLIGGAAAVMVSMNQRGLEFKQTMDELNTYMESTRLPKEMRERLRRYFQHRDELETTPRYRYLLDMMSPQLQREVCLYTNAHWLSRIPFLNYGDPSEAFLVEIALALEPVIIDQGECYGEIWTMYCVNEGLVALSSRMLGRGCVWGDDLVLNDISLCEDPSVVAVTHSELLELTRQNLDNVTKLYPEESKILRKHAVRLAVRRGILREAVRRAVEMYELENGAGSSLEEDEAGGTQEFGVTARHSELSPQLAGGAVKSKALQSAAGKMVGDTTKMKRLPKSYAAKPNENLPARSPSMSKKTGKWCDENKSLSGHDSITRSTSSGAHVRLSESVKSLDGEVEPPSSEKDEDDSEDDGSPKASLPTVPELPYDKQKPEPPSEPCPGFDAFQPPTELPCIPKHSNMEDHLSSPSTPISKTATNTSTASPSSPTNRGVRGSVQARPTEQASSGTLHEPAKSGSVGTGTSTSTSTTSSIPVRLLKKSNTLNLSEARRNSVQREPDHRRLHSLCLVLRFFA